MAQFPIGGPAGGDLTHLALALDEIDVGILLLDSDMRAQFLNRRQADLFNVTSDVLASEPTFRDLLSHALASSRFQVPPSEIQDYLDRLDRSVRTGSMSPTHLDLCDGGRLLVACKPCPNGGRILTYADVSQEVRPEELVAMELINAELRFNTETMEDHASQLASLAEATDESIRKVEEAKRQLEQEILERQQLEAQLRQMATTDALTGALNRAGFLALARNELQRSSKDNRPFALMMLDVDHFKSINDRFGHAIGDLALKHLVTQLTARIRRGDLLGRLGGEEFAVLMPDVPPSDAGLMAERLVSHVAANPVAVEDRALKMTISIGLTMARDSDQSIDRIIARADDALYRAKGSGRNRVVKDVEMEAA